MPNTSIALLYGVHGSSDGKIANTDPDLVRCFSLAEDQVKRKKKQVIKEKNITFQSVILKAEDLKAEEINSAHQSSDHQTPPSSRPRQQGQNQGHGEENKALEQ